MPISIARTGYTGEDGVEVFFPAKDAAKIWNLVLDKGKPLGIRPCGLGARDTLRLEMCYPLNGSDLSPEHNPIEAGLGFFVDLKKPEFIGRERSGAATKSRAHRRTRSLSHDRQRTAAASSLFCFQRRTSASAK